MPLVETPNDGHFACIRSPHAEAGSQLAARVHQVHAQLLVHPVMAAFVEQIEVVFCQQGNIVANRGGRGFSRLAHRFSGYQAWALGPLCPLVYPTSSPFASFLHARLLASHRPPGFREVSHAMPVLRVVLLWHQHQPFYKDLVTGEYRLPWVRLHALKDYYGMVKLLDEFPNVHQNFNLVPSLITQIQDYVSGSAQDPFLQVAAKPAKDLTPEERRFALQYLFQANPVHMIGRYPRYRELWERFRGSGNTPERAEKYFQPQDFTDLQVLSQISWFDEFFLQDPEVAALIRKGRNYSLDDQRFVILHQRELLAKVLPAHGEAAQRGSIEIST